MFPVLCFPKWFSTYIPLIHKLIEKQVAGVMVDGGYPVGALAPPWQQKRSASFWHFQMTLCCNCPNHVLSMDCKTQFLKSVLCLLPPSLFRSVIKLLIMQWEKVYIFVALERPQLQIPMPFSNC